MAKTKELQPAESDEVVLTFRTPDLSSYDEECASYVMEAGTYQIRVGNSSAETKACAALHLDETAVVKKCKNICPGADLPAFKIENRKEAEAAEVPVIELHAAAIETVEVAYSADPTELPKTKECTFEDVKNRTVSLDDFVGTLTNEQLAYLSSGLLRIMQEWDRL